MKRRLAGLFCAGIAAIVLVALNLNGQTTAPTPGTVTYSAAKTSVLVASTPQSPPVVTCTITGNAIPATGITVACTVAGVQVPAYQLALKANQSYSFSHNFGADGITVIATTSAAGLISVVATADGSTQTGGVF